MKFDFKQKTAVITGATGHLGRAFTLAIAKLGASCILIDKDITKLQQLLNQLENHTGETHMMYCCNLENKSSRKNTINQLTSEKAQIDVLVNNAAFTGDTTIPGWAEQFDGQTIEAWQKAMEVNLNSCFELCQKLTPQLNAGKHPSIINIGSIYATLGPDFKLYENINMHNPAAYGVSKAGLVYLTKWLASALSPNIRVNSVSPGGIFRNQDPKFVERYTNKTPLGRMAHENDIIPAMLFLASEHSSYITGQNIIIDGGYTIT